MIAVEVEGRHPKTPRNTIIIQTLRFIKLATAKENTQRRHRCLSKKELGWDYCGTGLVSVSRKFEGSGWEWVLKKKHFWLGSFNTRGSFSDWESTSFLSSGSDH